MGSRATGRALIGGVRDLTAADLADELNQTSNPSGVRSPGIPLSSPPISHLANLEKLRNIHHRIARVLAGFDGNVNAAAAVLGMDPGRIHSLRGNPTFVELVAFYRDRTDEVLLDIRGRMELLAHDTLAELHERLIGEGDDSPTNRELLEMAKEFLDRLGHGPVQRGVVANVNLTAQEMSDLFTGSSRVRVVEDVREAAPPVLDGETE